MNSLQRLHIPLESVSLIEVLSGDFNPFRRYPELATIWNKDSARLAEEAIDETFQAHNEAASQTPPLPFDEGKIFLIVQNQQPIGITGYLPWSEDHTSIGLRWHGLLPEHGGSGLSAKVMETMRGLAWEHGRNENSRNSRTDKVAYW